MTVCDFEKRTQGSSLPCFTNRVPSISQDFLGQVSFGAVFTRMSFLYRLNSGGTKLFTHGKLNSFIKKWKMLPFFWPHNPFLYNLCDTHIKSFHSLHRLQRSYLLLFENVGLGLFNFTSIIMVFRPSKNNKYVVRLMKKFLQVILPADLRMYFWSKKIVCFIYIND